MGDGEKSAVTLTLSWEMSGLEEIAANLLELSDWLSKAQRIISELSSGHEFDIDFVQTSSPDFDVDVAAAFLRAAMVSAFMRNKGRYPPVNQPRGDDL